MKRKTIMLLSALLAVIMLFAACGAPQAKDSASAGSLKDNESAAPSLSAGASPSASASADENPVVGAFDGNSVYYKDFYAWLGMAYYANTLTSTDDSNALLDGYMNYLAESIELKSKGYTNLTPEEVTAAEKNASDLLSQAVANYTSAGYTVTEDDVITDMGVTKEQFIEFNKFLTAETKAKTGLVGEQTPTEDQIKTEYDKNVANDKSEVEKAATYYTDNSNEGTTVYYVPSGVRMVKRILIPVDDDTTGAVGTLRGTYDDAADLVLNAGLQKIKSKAQEMYNAVSKGKMTFDAAMKQYGKDEKMTNGYAVITGSTYPDEDFVTKAMALTKVGDISQLFSTDEGYQVIQYTGDKTAGPVSFDEVKDKVAEKLKEDMVGSAWAAQVKQWKDAHKVTCDYDALPSQES